MRLRRLAGLVAVALATVLTGALAAARPAAALLPDTFGFALWSGGVVSQQWPAATTVSPGVPGRWVVRFPGIGVPGGVVHVTAVHDALANPPGRWCQADSWGVVGPDEIVRVSCYRPGGILDPQPGFSVQFARSSGVFAGQRFGYVDAAPAGGTITQYNTTGAANTVTNVGAGLYSVALPGLGTAGPQAGGVQVTAANPAAGARCKVASWQSSANGQFFRVFCFNPAGALANTRFSLTWQYQRALYGGAAPPYKFGYLWNTPPLGPALTNFNSGGPAGVLAGGPPVWTVSFAAIGSPPGNVQVTAFGTTPDFCGLHQPWTPGAGALGARINCFTNAGTPVNSGFTVEYSSRF
ncbi:hypothetical protein Daura_41465 [Dactylosporangium aurantiacum]|uniref:Uncharacterized protein n=1 Tax=Dactylosporangium aurantiacum TaxID=35754 RepID=A0A9Q9MKN2_9ACTN|nr:hypothetical protein [Dactylosporangium aurantiacum]MDG6102750.1 hypothetical protein [Dactylosporangium aurantiacum]UWZ53007.1 hypothetical protein Daura_41465 [Dactylosporangium aurantiacum]